MKKLLVVTIAVTLLTAWYYWKHPLGTKIKIGNHIFPVELAVTEAEKRRGLNGREFLPENGGMLFVYDHKEQYHFWMKDMKFPLDFIWIDEKTVVDLTPNVAAPLPAERLEFIKPSVPVDKILEVNAGTINRLGIQLRDHVEFLDK